MFDNLTRSESETLFYMLSRAIDTVLDRHGWKPLPVAIANEMRCLRAEVIEGKLA